MPAPLKPASRTTAPGRYVVAKRIGRETVQYVSNIYKYYIAYRLIADTIDLRGQA